MYLCLLAAQREVRYAIGLKICAITQLPYTVPHSKCVKIIHLIADMVNNIIESYLLYSTGLSLIFKSI